MIITEFYAARPDGVKLYRTYSDEHRCIERDGTVYEEAIDPEGLDRTYVETDRWVAGYVPPESEIAQDEDISREARVIDNNEYPEEYLTEGGASDGY